MRKTVGIFGGTFDPIHLGHLRMALEIKQLLRLDEMRLVPCHKPPHRHSPQASSLQRAEMLQLALQNCPDIVMDLRELNRDKPSYTYDTLQELREELGSEISIVLCMGADAFAGIPQWHRWQELVALAHILVIARPGWAIPESAELCNVFGKFHDDLRCISESPFGAVVVQSLRLLPISATDIRAHIHRAESAQFLVPDAVWSFITANHLYR